jgi:hypothetical protein
VGKDSLAPQLMWDPFKCAPKPEIWVTLKSSACTAELSGSGCQTVKLPEEQVASIPSPMHLATLITMQGLQHTQIRSMRRGGIDAVTNELMREGVKFSTAGSLIKVTGC